MLKGCAYYLGIREGEGNIGRTYVRGSIKVALWEVEIKGVTLVFECMQPDTVAMQ